MLAILRALILLIYFVGLNIVLIFIFLCRPFHRNNVAIAGKWYASMAWIFNVKVELEGEEHIDPAQNYVCIANHQSTFDLMTTAKCAFNGITTIGKKQLKYIPIFGLIYWLSGNIMIDRRNSGRAQDTLKETARQVNDTKRSVLFFPEGTRSYGRGLLPFKTGAFRIARVTRCPIMMICTSSTHGKIRWNRWDNGVVKVRYYAPEKMDKSRDIKGWAQYYYDKMHQRIIELDSEIAALEHTKRA